MIVGNVLEITKEIALANLKTFRVNLSDSMRGNTFREGVLFKGEFGWAEFAPFPDHKIEHSSRWLQAALEMAWTKLPQPAVPQVAVNAISTSPDPFEAIKIIEASGCQTLKLKLSGIDLVKDLELIRTIHEVKPNTIFRIDFNGNLSPDQILKYEKNFADINIEYIEQPCKSLEEIRELRKISGMKIAVDESLRLALDSTDRELVNSIIEISDFVIIKPIPIGGIKRFQTISEQVKDSGKQVVVSGSMDTSIGLYLTTLAQSLLAKDYQVVAGAGTGSLLATDVVQKTLKPHNGVVDVLRLDIDEQVILKSSNDGELRNKISEAFDFGRERGWF